MPWRRQPSHKLVALAEVWESTGLEPAEILLRPDTQQLTVIARDEQRTEFVRIPLELLRIPSEGTDDPCLSRRKSP